MNPPSNTPEVAFKNAGGSTERVVPFKSPDPPPPAAHPGSLPFITFADVEPSLAANDFVEGLLGTGAMSVVYGESNCGKTFFALDVALHVAHGKPLFGRQVIKGPVLYLALEGGNGFRNRIVAFRTAHGISSEIIPFAAVTQSLNLLDPEGDLAAIIKTAAAVQDRFGAMPVLIVIDTLSRAMPGGNENAPEDMTALVRAGDRLRAATGAHCLWVHHSGKDQARGARGHSSLRAATDTEIEVIADGSARRAEVKKQRDLEGGDIIQFELRSVEVGINDRGKPITSCIVEPKTEGDVARLDPAKSLSKHNRRAYEILRDVVVGEGVLGHAGTPDDVLSVPDHRWREQFYNSAMSGATQDTKKRAFRRAADNLEAQHLVATSGGRVWVTTRNQPGRDIGT